MPPSSDDSVDDFVGVGDPLERLNGVAVVEEAVGGSDDGSEEGAVEAACGRRNRRGLREHVGAGPRARGVEGGIPRGAAAHTPLGIRSVTPQFDKVPLRRAN